MLDTNGGLERTAWLMMATGARNAMEIRRSAWIDCTPEPMSRAENVIPKCTTAAKTLKSTSTLGSARKDILGMPPRLALFLAETGVLTVVEKPSGTYRTCDDTPQAGVENAFLIITSTLVLDILGAAPRGMFGAHWAETR